MSCREVKLATMINSCSKHQNQLMTSEMLSTPTIHSCKIAVCNLTFVVDLRRQAAVMLWNSWGMPNLYSCRCHGWNKQSRYSSHNIPQSIIAWHLQFEPVKLLTSKSQYWARYKAGQSTVFSYIAEQEGSCLTWKTESELSKGRSRYHLWFKCR